jgi:tetratricopeptide (TPR) repeat protein/tRNA A-37 threonylcarbamoyl transferase component Bud32
MARDSSPQDGPPANSSAPSQSPSQFDTIAPQSDRGTKASAPATELTVAPSDREESKRLNRYLIKNFHARGGMGEVWLSHDPDIGREVAIKRLSASSRSASERFLTEAQITGQLQHPCIVPVHDMGEDELGRPYYVMKFVRGKSLKQEIIEIHGKRGDEHSATELQRANLLNVFVGICQAVAYAHSRGVLHRDIKPDNIMLGEYGEIVLLDWGLAKVSGQPEMFGNGGSFVQTTSGSLSATEAGSVLGSPLYMPPEMAEGRIADTDERTDIYLLGATLYEILTGRTPREGRSRAELLDLARTAAPVSPRTICNCDKAIDAICLKAMSRQKEDRYRKVSDLLDDIQRYLVGEPVSAFREGLAARLWRWCKRHRVALQRSAATLVIAGAALFFFIKWRELDHRQRLAQQQAAQLQARDQARQQIQTFDRLLDEARFYAASTDPVAEHAPYFDSDKARVAEQAALAASAEWGDDLNKLVLSDQAPRLRSRLYELLLLMTQSQLQIAGDASSQTIRSLLDRAALLNPALSRGYYRLKADYLKRVNDSEGATKQQQSADDPKTPSIAFDHFLLGEEARRKAVSGDAALYNGLQAAADRNRGIEHAVTEYALALDLDPTLYWAQFQLGRCYLSLGRTAEAVQALGTCVALRPDAPWSYSARGMAMGVLGRFDEARADLDHALQLDPNFLPAMLNRGAVRWMQTDSKGALADFTRILDAPEDHRLIEAAFYRAQINVEAGNLDDALTDLNAVIAQHPDFAEAILLRGRVQLLKGNTTTCLSDLNRWLKSSRGVEVSPQNAAGLMERAEFLRSIAASLPPDAAASAVAVAREDIDSAIRLGEHSSRVYGDKGAILDLLGDLNGAISQYSLAILTDPLNNQSQINRGWAYQKAGNLKQSAEDFQSVARRNPESAEAHSGLAYVQACQGDEAGARDQASQAMIAGSDDYLILHNVACVYAQLSENQPARREEVQDVAIATLQKALQVYKLNPKGPDEYHLIEQEPAFTASLRARPEFQLLLSGNRK